MVLVERDGELAELELALERCRTSGTQGAVVVEGPAGMGKTTILDSFLERAAGSGAVVLTATAAPQIDLPPLGVVRQLLVSPALPAVTARRLTERLGAGLPGAGRPAAPGEAAVGAESLGADTIDVIEELSVVIHTLAARSPVVIGVDDLHCIDAPSLWCLLYLMRRTRSAPVLLFFTQCRSAEPRRPALAVELLRHAPRRIRLRPLSREGVRRVVESQGEPLHAPGFADECHAISGGNPLLVRAVIEDHHMGAGVGPREGGRAPGGEAYAQAVVTCLHRTGPLVTDVARALAVLGEHSSLELLGRLVGIAETSVAQTLDALETAGIVDRCRFRHPLARSAVRESLPPERRLALHRRAADLLHAAGAPAATVADHLRAGRDVSRTSEIGILQDAAEHALVDDRASEAISYLELARDGCPDPQRRMEIVMRLATVARRVSLYAAEQHVDGALAALRAGELSVSWFGPLAGLLASQGRFDDAQEVLDRLDRLSTDVDPRAEAESHVTTLWASIAHPPLAPVSVLAARSPRRSVPVVRRVDAGRDGLAGDDVVAASEQLLAVSTLTDTTLDPMVNAVKTLLCRGRLDRALHWTDVLLEQAAKRDAPGWQALFSWVRSQISLRRGDLAEAESFALAALDRLPERSGCVFAGAPIATLVHTYVLMGRHEEAARFLDKPVTERVFKSKYGLSYRRARGHYYLATNRVHSALGDFLAVGQGVERWGVDDPPLLPWRTEAAEALLRLGDREEADRLAADQLSRAAPDDGWIRGLALRLRAATQSGPRTGLLVQAVEALKVSGDRLELARALAELGEAHQAGGYHARARSTARAAWRLANECGAEPLCRRIGPGQSAGLGGVDDARPTAGASPIGPELSESERRVAALAACGVTNREIASKLYVTVSTVEQHLTRVYRKLNIAGRQELPTDLQFEVDAIA